MPKLGLRRRGRADARSAPATTSAKPLIFVDLAAPAGEPVELFVEGPSAGMGLAHPQAGARRAAPAAHHFGFELDGLPPGVNPKGAVRADLHASSRAASAIEVKTHLD